MSRLGGRGALEIENQMTSRVVSGAAGELLPAFQILAEVCADARCSAAHSNSALATRPRPPSERWGLALPTIRRWAQRYLRRRFHWSSAEAARATHEALVDDALQHLLEVGLQGKYSGSASNLPAF